MRFPDRMRYDHETVEAILDGASSRPHGTRMQRSSPAPMCQAISKEPFAPPCESRSKEGAFSAEQAPLALSLPS